jgi:hypothetical protein
MATQIMHARRTLAISLVATFFLTGALPAQAAGVDTVSGRVYHDTNGNGLFDPGEKGIAEVRVTDGISFATTDADGAYSIKIAEDYMIPCRPARTVSVCWPTGKWPTGRWWYRLSEIADAKAVSFGLRNDEQKLPFVFLHTSDDHGAGQMYSEHYAHDARLMKPAAKFIFNTGDMGYATPEGGDVMFRSIAGHAAAFPLPMFVTPGNHDFVGGDGKTPMNQASGGWGFQTRYLGPVRWSFDYAGVHFIGLDYMEKTEKGYQDKIPHVAVQFMEKDLATLAKGTRVVLLVHCYDASAGFYQALHKFKIDQICSGHTHAPSYARVGRVPTITNYGVGTGVVTAEAIDMAERRPLTYGNSPLLGYFKQVTMAAMERRRQKQHALANKVLDNASFAIEGSPQTESVEIIAEIIPGSTRKVGFRVGTKDAIEITFDGKAVNVAGAPVPFSLIPEDMTIPPAPDAPANTPARKIPADTSVRWHILIDRDRLSILANNLFCVSKAIKVDHPAAVTLLTDGGNATFTQCDVWELRTITNPASRGLHHFAPPAWKWGGLQLVAACLDDKSKEAEEMLKRFSADGVKDYDMEP